MDLGIRKRLRTASTQQGTILVIGAFILALGLLLAGWVINSGYLYVSSAKLNNIASILSQAGLDAYYRSTAVTPQLKAQDAVTAMSDLLKKPENKLQWVAAPSSGSLLEIWTSGDTTEVAADKWGKVQFGEWKDETGTCSDSLATSGPTLNAPCFNPKSMSDFTLSAPPNAVRIILSPPANSPLTLPLGNLFGNPSKDLTARAIGKAVQRCVVFALDTSISSQRDSHWWVPELFNGVADSSLVYPTAGANFFAKVGTADTYPTDTLRLHYLLPKGENPNVFRTPSLWAVPYELGMENAATYCSSPVRYRAGDEINAAGTVISDTWSRYRSFWCSLQEARPSPASLGIVSSGISQESLVYQYDLKRGNTPPIMTQYRSDFTKFITPQGTYMIDLFRAAEPFRTFLLSFNAGLVKLKERKTSVDFVSIFSFGPTIYGLIPGNGYLSNSSDAINFMIDLTNYNRIGTKTYGGGGWTIIGQEHPNFLERGWFPSPDVTGTDISYAVWQAKNTLVNGCPKGGRRSIVLATDGVLSQASYGGNAHVDIPDPNGFKAYRTIDDPYFYNTAIAMHDYLIPDWFSRRGLPKNPDGTRNLSILNDSPKNRSLGNILLDEHIQVTTLLAGKGIFTHMYNRAKNEKRFYDIDEGLLIGGRADPDNGSKEWPINEWIEDFDYDPGIGIKNPNRIPAPLLLKYPECSGVRQCFPNPNDKSYCTVDWADNATAGQVDCAMAINGLYPTVRYSDPNPIFLRLAYGTQGYFCPLMAPIREGGALDPGAPISSKCYDNTGEWDRILASSAPECGGENNTESGSVNVWDRPRRTASLHAEEMSEQAAKCIGKLLGDAPFTLQDQ